MIKGGGFKEGSGAEHAIGCGCCATIHAEEDIAYLLDVHKCTPETLLGLVERIRQTICLACGSKEAERCQCENDE